MLPRIVYLSNNSRSMLLRRTSSRQWQLPFATSLRPGWLLTPLSFLIVVVILLLQAHTGVTQVNQTTPLSTARTDSSRGYWRLKTQPASRNTSIQFFGPAGQLLYEENLPEKWVKLSRKNQAQFDQLLDQLRRNQLLADRIKTEPLPPTPTEPAPRRITDRPNMSAYYPSSIAAYRVHAYVNPTGKLYLFVDNPDRLRYKISVVDQQDRALYEEFTNLVKYRRKLDLSTLYVSCQVIVHIDDKPFIYKISRQDTKSAYRIQPSSVAGMALPVDQNREGYPPLMPVTIDL